LIRILHYYVNFSKPIQERSFYQFYSLTFNTGYISRTKMHKKNFHLKESDCTIYFNDSFSHLEKIADKSKCILLIDKIVYKKHTKIFRGWEIILCEGGEEHKNQKTIQSLILQLISIGANRETILVGIGGGVVTDMAGFIAGIYMRGIRFGFIPTTLLAMVDASLGGKNGVNAEVYKNMIGLISHPSFILYDKRFLSSLPNKEWVNGFAEIIKHACIFDRTLFKELQKNHLQAYQHDQNKLDKLIAKNVHLKMKIVQKDPLEKHERKLLNFGHTLGHAIENELRLSHGQAISIGMVAAAKISKNILNFKETDEIIALLEKYKLPIHHRMNMERILPIMLKDKKSNGDTIDYILLKSIGKGVIQSLPIPRLFSEFQNVPHAVLH